jgi:hypothetical protein
MVSFVAKANKSLYDFKIVFDNKFVNFSVSKF